MSIDRPNLTSKIEKELFDFKNVIENQKGLFTVLITLGIHKILYPEQDIRKHQNGIPGGFSGRTIDTKFITPTLRELELPSMRESGWLTRSLEQPHPYDKNYPGKIQTGKRTFLNLVHFIETENKYVEDIVLSILNLLEEIKEKNKIQLNPLQNIENFSLVKVTKDLKKLTNKKYKSSGGSKLPVLIFYSLLKILCEEVVKYQNCHVKKLGSHLSPDSKSKSSGDIEILKGDILYESYEIKLDVKITNHIINRVKDKIYRHNPQRYYVFSSNIDSNQKKEIKTTILEIRKDHGCQVIIDDPLKVINRYLRIISRLDLFIGILSNEIINDKELKIEHKKEWKRIYDGINED